jgi:hypothetical protein
MCTSYQIRVNYPFFGGDKGRQMAEGKKTSVKKGVIKADLVSTAPSLFNWGLTSLTPDHCSFSLRLTESTQRRMP